MFAHIFGGVMNDSKPWVIERLPDFLNEHLVDFENNKPGIRMESVEDKTSYCAVSGAEFHYSAGGIGLDMADDCPAQEPRTGRNASRGAKVSDTFP